MDELNIIFEDEEIIIIDKSAGLVVNQSETNKGPTLQDQMLKHLSSALPKGSDPYIGERAGIVHRLDRETSGLVVCAKTQRAYENLQRQFKNREVKKEYAALVHGFLKNLSGTISANIGRVGKFGKFGIVPDGRESRTGFEVEGRYKIKEDRFNVILSGSEGSSKDSSSSTQNDNGRNFTKSRVNYLKNHARDYSFVTLYPKTGRTHQIRVHLKSIGHPVVSDLIYAPAKLLKFDMGWCPRLFLHAKSLEFIHPASGKRIFFDSDLPGDLKLALNQLTIDS